MDFSIVKTRQTKCRLQSVHKSTVFYSVYAAIGRARGGRRRRRGGCCGGHCGGRGDGCSWASRDTTSVRTVVGNTFMMTAVLVSFTPQCRCQIFTGVIC